MLGWRIRRGLLGLGLSGLLALPAMAQGWPSQSGPNGDHLGLTMRQFDRLAPPPVENDRGERPVPNLTVPDLPAGSVDVGMPMLGPSPMSQLTPPHRSPRREARHRDRGSVAARASQAPIQEESRLDRLERELAERGRQIEQLQQQIAQDRQRVPGPSSTQTLPSGRLFSISPAAAATVAPR